MKVTVVGAGNVGATCADVLAQREIANEIVLLDIKEGFAEGKALDIWQTSTVNLYDSRTVGSTSNYEMTKVSEVVVITSGLPAISNYGVTPGADLFYITYFQKSSDVNKGANISIKYTLGKC